MSTGFKPIEIPPGVVAKATKKMRSSNWSEVNLVRWREGQLQPMGGQAQLSNLVSGVEQYKFASRCKLIHGWYDINPGGAVYHIAYLCESNLYVDTGGTLTEITPTGGIAPPSGVVGGFGDGVYSENVLLAAGAPWSAGAMTITMAVVNPGSVLPGHGVYNTSTVPPPPPNQSVGVVQAYTGTLLTLAAPAIMGGNAGDILDFDWYGKQRAIPTSVAITKLPDCYSLDNFGSILYAMTSADGRLLMWDPSLGAGAVGGVTAVGPFTTAAAIIYTTVIPALVVAGMTVTDLTNNHVIGAVSTVVANSATINAAAAFTASQSTILMALAAPAGIGPGLTVTDTANGFPVGTIAAYGPVSNTVNATGAFTTISKGINMPPNTGWAIPGMTVFDVTTGQTIGVVQTYGPANFQQSASAPGWGSGVNTFPLNNASLFGIVPGMTVYDLNAGQFMPGVVASVAANTVTMSQTIPFTGGADLLNFSSGANHVLMLAAFSAFNSSGAADSIRISGAQVMTLTANSACASSGAADALSISGGSKLTLAANSLFASSGAADALQFSSNRAVVQPAASGRGPVPTGRCFVVTQERFIQVFGAVDAVNGGGPRRFAWCDEENPGAWDYTNVTSQAGYLDIEPASPIITAIAGRFGTLFWTAKKVYSSRFLGFPYIYNAVELADGSTPWSPQSVAVTSSMILWMSEQGPYSYDGTSILPIKCMVWPWADDNLDPIAVRELSFATHLSEFSEWWWFFPTLGSPFNTRAVVFNYNEGWWTEVQLSRSAGMTSSYTSHPIFADDTVAIQHEIFNATSYVNFNMQTVAPFAETFDLNLGDKLMTVKQLLPDVEALDPTDANAAALAIANLRYSLFYRNSRSLGTPEMQSPRSPVRPDGYVDFRTTGRDVRLRLDVGSLSVQPFTLGQHLIDAVARGDR